MDVIVNLDVGQWLHLGIQVGLPVAVVAAILAVKAKGRHVAAPAPVHKSGSRQSRKDNPRP